MSSIEVRIPRNQRKRPVSFAADDFLRKKKIVSPGDVITEASDYMRLVYALILLFPYWQTHWPGNLRDKRGIYSTSSLTEQPFFFSY